jgi:hypothetical protein
MLLNNIKHLRYSLALLFVAASVTGNTQTQPKTPKSETSVRSVTFITPNPFKDYVNLSSDAVKPHYKLEIFSLIGELIVSRNAESTVRLPKLPRGIYLARLTNEKGQQVISQKIVKI